MKSLLDWTSFPVIVLFILAVIELLPLARRGLRQSCWWQAAAWFWRPVALWAVFNIVYRLCAAHGFNNRCTFPFYFNTWTNDTWACAAQWLVHSPAFWLWSGVLAVLGLLFWFVCRRILAGPVTNGQTALLLALLTLFGFLFPLVYDCIPQGIGNPRAGTGSFAGMWVDSGNTMLYCMPLVKSTSHYLRHFEKIQPKLKTSIHGADHPPGASLALYWLGKPCGARQDVYRDWWRYELATTAFAAMSVLAMFFLGWSMFRSRTIGLMSAAMWAVKPTSLAYNVFAPDAVYWVFYILCFGLSWRVVVSAARPYPGMVALGIVWAVLALLNFNFPLLVAMFGVFLLLHAYRQGRPAAEWLWRAILPLAVAAILLLVVCLYYRLDYAAIFIFALKNFSFYNLDTCYKWVMSLLGGQLDVLIMAGSLTGYIFLTCLPRWMRTRPIAPQIQYALVILAIYLVAVIILKDLKVEAGRIWAWTMAVPLVLVANHVWSMARPRFWFLMIVILSLLQYYGMRLILVSAG